MECSTQEWCLGGDACKKGHIGLACSECSKGWFIFQGSCFPCQKNARYYSLIFMGVVLCVGAIVMLVFADKLGKMMRSAGVMKKKLKKQLGKNERGRAAKAGSVVFLVMFITYLQIQGLMIGVNIPWPGPITEFFIALGAMINFDIWGMISPQCSVDMSFEASWMVRLVSPVAVLLPVACGLYWYSLKPGKADLADRVFGVIIQVLHMMFVSTTLHSLQPFDCMLLEPAVVGTEGQSGESKWVMDRYPQITCDTGDDSYFRMVVAGISGFVIYTALYFLFVMYTLYKIHEIGKRWETWVPPPGALGHPSFIPDMRAAKKRARAAARGEEVAFDPKNSEVAFVGAPPEVTEETLGDSNDSVSSDKVLPDMSTAETREASEVDGGETGGPPVDEKKKKGKNPFSKKNREARKNGEGTGDDTHELGALPPAEGLGADTAGPVTEGFFSRRQKPALDPNRERDSGDDDYVSDDEPDEGEIIEARLHPEVRHLLKRYGLVILPYQQRAWFWELFSMMNKLLLAMTATFFSRTPKLQMELMLGQNTVWLVLLLFARPFCAVPFKGGPMERFFADVGAGELKPHWSPGNIVETAMACGSVTIAAMGVSVASGTGDPDAQSGVFFVQLFLILVFIGRALQTAGNGGSSFFGPALTAAGRACGTAISEFLVRVGLKKKKEKKKPVETGKPTGEKSAGAKNRWAKLRADAGLSDAVNTLHKQPMMVKMALEVRRKADAATAAMSQGGKRLGSWLDEGKNGADQDDDDLEEVPPGRVSLFLARCFIRASPLFFVIFLAIPIGISTLTVPYGFLMDSSMDAFNIRDHPAAEDFTTFVNARDRSKEQRELGHYVRIGRFPNPGTLWRRDYG